MPYNIKKAYNYLQDICFSVSCLCGLRKTFFPLKHLCATCASPFLIYFIKKCAFALRVSDKFDIFAMDLRLNKPFSKTYLLYSLSFTTEKRANAHKELPRKGADFSHICAWFVVNREAYGESLRLF